jgi:hypothetical protein
MKKLIIALLVLAAIGVAQATTTTCHWEGYGNMKQWVCTTY